MPGAFTGLTPVQCSDIEHGQASINVCNVCLMLLGSLPPAVHTVVPLQVAEKQV